MTTEHKVHVTFPGRLICIGFGSIGQGVLPLILRHVGGLARDRISIVTADDAGLECAREYGIRFLKQPLTRENFRQVLEPMVGRGDFVLNVSVDVSSIALIKFCWERGALYLDTCIEPWPGGYTDPSLSPSRRSNYALREEALALRKLKEKDGTPRPTAVVTHGANPGLVQHFLKQALLNVAADLNIDAGSPASRADWANLARSVGVKVVHVAERDTQVPSVPKRIGEFVNTWSVDGFVSEGCQPAELGWGTHERNFPRDGRKHDFGGGAAIYLMQPGAATRVRTWTPKAGYFHGFLITHGEAISIADYFTLREKGKVVYRPTCHYAYHPCDDAVLSNHEMGGKNWVAQPKYRIFMDEIFDGVDELGALLMGHAKGAYWYGSRLSIQQARSLAPFNSATSLQVVVGVLGAMVWALENPRRGMVEPDDMDYRRVLDIADPYLGDIVGQYSDWTPLKDRGWLYDEGADVDPSDPWQFKNFRVV